MDYSLNWRVHSWLPVGHGLVELNKSLILRSVPNTYSRGFYFGLLLVSDFHTYARKIVRNGSGRRHEGSVACDCERVCTCNHASCWKDANQSSFVLPFAGAPPADPSNRINFRSPARRQKHRTRTVKAKLTVSRVRAVSSTTQKKSQSQSIPLVVTHCCTTQH